MNHIKIGKRKIGSDNPCFIIAEAGVNHNGKLELALELVEKAKEAGADCVKFQTFQTESIITKNAPKAKYQLLSTNAHESQYDMLKKLELNFSDYEKIISHCRKYNIQFLSTPYNYSDARFLNNLGVDAFKIASGQIIETPFLEKMAKFNKPIIISSGMATLSEVYEGISAIRMGGNEQIILLQCTTNYPSNISEANIRAMEAMKSAMNVIVGYSDHVQSNYATYAAVARGASLIEKHFTLDRKLPGPDHSASLDPSDFQVLVNGIKAIESALGNPVKMPTQNELHNITGMRRSIVSIKHIKKGDIITSDSIDFKRPATGLKPTLYNELIGKKATRDIEIDCIIEKNMIAW